MADYPSFAPQHGSDPNKPKEQTRIMPDMMYSAPTNSYSYYNEPKVDEKPEESNSSNLLDRMSTEHTASNTRAVIAVILLGAIAPATMISLFFTILGTTQNMRTTVSIMAGIISVLSIGAIVMAMLNMRKNAMASIAIVIALIVQMSVVLYTAYAFQDISRSVKTMMVKETEKTIEDEIKYHLDSATRSIDRTKSSLQDKSQAYKDLYEKLKQSSQDQINALRKKFDEVKDKLSKQVQTPAPQPQPVPRQQWHQQPQQTPPSSQQNQSNPSKQSDQLVDKAKDVIKEVGKNVKDTINNK
jgi:hypothetical protein